MGILSYLRGDDLSRKALTGTPAVLDTLNRRQFNPYISLGGTNLRADRINAVYVQSQSAAYSWIYERTPTVRRVVDYIARNIAQLGVKVYKRVDDDHREHVGDHPAAQALRNPNPQTPGAYFLQTFVTDHLIYGNAYALKFRQGNGDLWLYSIPPSVVGLVGRSRFQVEAYRIFRDDGTRFDISPDDIIHWRGSSGSDPRRGESYLETLREELASDAASRQAVTELYRAGLTPHGWIERPLEAPEISQDGLKRLAEDLANQAKAGTRRWPILEEGMSLKQAGTTPEDAELRETRQWTAEHVASLYGMKNIPPETEEERKQFYADVLPPLTEMCASFFDLQILIAEYNAKDHYCEFGREKLLDEVYKTMTSASGRPVLLTNEARAKLDLPPVDDGDELITPANVIVGDNPKPSPMVMPVQDPNKPSQEGDARSDDAPTPVPARGASMNGHSKAPLIPRRRQASARRDGWAVEYQGVMDRHFDRQRRSLKSKRAQAKAITDERWNKELASGLNYVAERQFEAEGNHAAFRLASTFDPAYGVNWLGEKAIGSAKAINQTTQDHAEQADLDQAFEQAKTRAPGAAMAYATDVAAFSTRVATEQAPGEPTVTIDGGECDVCAPFQGSFPASEVEWPAYHSNCNCVADVSGGVKAVPVETKAPIINVTLPSMQIVLPSVPEGAIQIANPVTVEGATILPADVKFDKGAFVNNIESPPPADVRVIQEPINVNVTSPDVTVEPPEVHVEAPKPPEINVEFKGGKTKKTVTFSDGETAEITDELQNKRTVEFSDGRKAEIEESDEDERQDEN